MRSKTFIGVCSLALTVGLFSLAAPAYAITKYQTSLVPNFWSATPGFSAKGSKIKINGHRSLKGKIKKVVDGTGTLVSTDGVPSADDYKIEVDLLVPTTALFGTVTVPFDVKNGNGKFSVNIMANPILFGAAFGDALVIQAIRVKDGVGTLIGVGGVTFE